MQVTTEFLQKKLSPLEDKEFTVVLREKLAGVDLTKFKRKFRGRDYIVLAPTPLWDLLFGTEPNKRDLTTLTRSLQALFWERSSLTGNLIFVKELDEYESFGY